MNDYSELENNNENGTNSNNGFIYNNNGKNISNSEKDSN